MSDIRFIAECTKIKDIAKFKEAVSEAVAASRGNHPGTKQYEYYIDEANLRCVVIETYASTDAIAGHVAKVGPIFPKLQALADISAEAFGDPDEKGLAMFKEFGVKVIPFFDGIRLD